MTILEVLTCALFSLILISLGTNIIFLLDLSRSYPSMLEMIDVVWGANITIWCYCILAFSNKKKVITVHKICYFNTLLKLKNRSYFAVLVTNIHTCKFVNNGFDVIQKIFHFLSLRDTQWVSIRSCRALALVWRLSYS